VKRVMGKLRRLRRLKYQLPTNIYQIGSKEHMEAFVDPQMEKEIRYLATEIIRECVKSCLSSQVQLASTGSAHYSLALKYKVSPSDFNSILDGLKKVYKKEFDLLNPS